MNAQELRERIEKLSPKQRALLAFQIKANRIDPNQSDSHEVGRLVAYIIDDGNLAPSDFRNHLKERLPNYMVPTAYIQLDEFPRLPNGKVNNQALPDPGEFSDSSDINYVAPETAIEQQLAAIWSEVLNFDPVGMRDNFFEIGGDSILSIQIIAKASKAGLILKSNSLFDHQTIAELALFVESGIKKKLPDDIITGEVPLLPIQHWFFEEHKHASHHWNQGLMFYNTGNFNAAHLQTAIQYLTFHHDALRLQFVREAGEWRAFITEPEKYQAFRKINLGGLSLHEQKTRVKEKTRIIQSSLNLSRGLLFQGIYFDCGGVQHDMLLLIAHHLLVDAVSWRILVEDLKAICQQLQEEAEISLPPKTTSYKEWGTSLLQLATSSEIQEEYEFWQAQTKSATRLPCDFEVPLPITEEHVDTIGFTLDIPTTQQLTSDTLNAYNTRIDEFLLAVLTQVISNWAGTTSICFGLERHGRETMDTDMNLSNSVGWFTSFFPITLNFTAGSDAGVILKSVKEQLRKVPNGGIGYGILRYLNKDDHTKINLQRQPSIIFNYLGNLVTFNAGVVGSVEELSECNRHVQSERHHMVEINSFIQENQLKMRWSYSNKLHQSDTIHRLVQAFEKTLRSFIAHCNTPDAGGFTPSDFPEAGLSQEDLDNLLGEMDL